MHDTKDIKELTYQTAFIETLTHVLKGNIGAGLFAMGDAFKNSGLLFGLIATIVIGCICIYNNHVLVRLSRVVRKRKQHPTNLSFPETITFSYEMGPTIFKKLAKTVTVIIKTSIYVTQLGFCVIYISLVGETLSGMLKGFFEIEIGVRYCILATFPLLLSVSLLNTLKFLTPVSAIATFGTVYSYVVTLVICAIALPDITTRRLISPVECWPLFIGTVIFSFEGISLTIPIRNEMKDANKFDKPLGPLNIGLAVIMFLLVSLGFFGYYRFGDEVKESVTLNLPEQSWPSDSAKAMFAMGMLLSYPLQFYVPCKILLMDLKARWGPLRYPLLTEMVLRTVLVIITYVIALTIPYINLLLSLIGAVCSNALTLLFPATADISVRCSTPPEVSKEGKNKEESEEELGKNTFRFFMDGISLLLSVIGTVFGTYVSVTAIVNKFVEELTERPTE